MQANDENPMKVGQQAGSLERSACQMNYDYINFELLKQKL